MKERPILMSTPMVQAVLDGRKTMTRRVVKKTPCTCGYPPGSHNCRLGNIGENQWACASLGFTGEFVRCPYGKVGDRLWVRESFRQMQRGIDYKADHDYRIGFTWKPSIHMPRAASRINLEITGVRVERLQEITEEDANAEGFPDTFRRNGSYESADLGKWKFIELWDALNTKRGFGWDVNPWVWVIEFKKITK